MGSKASVIGCSKDHQIDPGETPQKFLTERDVADQFGGSYKVKGTALVQ
ncbi:uncharacterized protein G2W53_014272 [Senna tora]|uniref:Uncharacterized protein n=1 Tax=Senna tora TaxID=362788 RepID=A0A834WT69_9FABA|nr:uncharacterized protein G2W53_014272 [Senna tora]